MHNRIDVQLERDCRESPQIPRDVVISLVEGTEQLGPAGLGLDHLEEIEGQPGMLKGSITGEKILELKDRDEVEYIGPDFEVSIHSG